MSYQIGEFEAALSMGTSLLFLFVSKIRPLEAQIETRLGLAEGSTQHPDA
jgi:hypothetical protein